MEVFGEAKGKHARSAVGTNALPLNVPVEVSSLCYGEGGGGGDEGRTPPTSRC